MVSSSHVNRGVINLELNKILYSLSWREDLLLVGRKASVDFFFFFFWRILSVVCFVKALVTFTVPVLHQVHWSHLSHKNILMHLVHEYFHSHSTQAKKKKNSLQSPLLLNTPPQPPKISTTPRSLHFRLHTRLNLRSFSSLFSFSSSPLFSWLLFIILFFFFSWWNSGYSIELWLSWKVLFLPTISPSCLLKNIGQI